MKDFRPVLYNILLLGFLGLLVYGLWSAPKWEWYHFVVCIVAAGFVALLGNMDRLESFKAGAGGIEAKTREVVAKAESALTELQLLAESVVGILYRVIDREGRFGGGSLSLKDAQKAELMDVLVRLGISDARRQKITELERPWVLVDYVGGITNGLPKDAGVNAAWNAAWEPYQHGLERPDPAALRALLQPFGPFEPWREALMSDYEHYHRTGQHRRPQVWAQRAQWSSWTREDSWPPG